MSPRQVNRRIDELNLSSPRQAKRRIDELQSLKGDTEAEIERLAHRIDTLEFQKDRALEKYSRAAGINNEESRHWAQIFEDREKALKGLRAEYKSAKQALGRIEEKLSELEIIESVLKLRRLSRKEREEVFARARELHTRGELL